MAKHLSLVGIKGTSLDEAYNRVLREAMLLSPRQVRHVNYDAERAATVALGTAKRLPPFKAELSALPRFPAERLEHLEDYALALYSAHLRCNFHSAPTDELTALSEAGSWWRRVLLADANSLAVRQHLRMEQLRVLRRSHGYRNIAHDLAGLAQIFKSEWARIKDHTGIKFAELEGVERLALDLTSAMASRLDANGRVDEARDVRARMFTLLVGVYDEVRRGLEYTRWYHHDAKKIAPPLRRSPRPSESAKTENAST
ncbi:MAG: hypothetical protein QM784_30510 [Polyangiaceae bacterium]